MCVGDARGPFELVDEGLERRRLLVPGAIVADTGMRLADDALGQHRRQPRLADARLAGNQCDASPAAAGVLPQPFKRLQLRGAADQRALMRLAQRLEAAFGTGGAEHPVGLDRLRETLQRHRPEVPVGEEPPGKLARRLSDDDRVRLGERLEAGDTDSQVIDFVVSRYGEFVLLKPRFSPRNALLWATPVLLLLAGGLLAVRVLRSRAAARPQKLTAAEDAELQRILDEGG